MLDENLRIIAILFAVALGLILRRRFGSKLTGYYLEPGLAMISNSREGVSRFEVTDPVQVFIGKPAKAIPVAIIESMRKAAASSGASEVYIFWMQIRGGAAHLGVGCAPGSQEVIESIGQSIYPIWSKYSPQNPYMDLLSLENYPISETIRREGIRLI
jgi:phosphate/sulfate permease